MSYQIAGIKILLGCKPHVRKVLKEGELYLFSSKYKRDTENELLLTIVEGPNTCARSLYDITTSSHSIEVSVSAIVGKNGDGKSALVEVLLRVLNNFALTHGFLNDQPSLKQVNGVNAILYYEIDNSIYSIRCKNETVAWYKDGRKLEVKGRLDDDIKRSLKNNFIPDLIYTMIINYSLYAYTPASLGDITEDNYWIDSLFHKNDSYQTPIVLNPMRTNGNIDVNREEYLSKQRLMAIFTVNKNKDKTREISSSEVAVGYAFSLEDESKFFRITVREYLLSHFYDDLIWESLKPYDFQNERLPEGFIERFEGFWNPFKEEIKKNSALINICKQTISNRRRTGKSDLRHYFTLIRNTINPVKRRSGKNSGKGFGREFGLFVNNQGALSMMNYRQFYRFLLILMVWKCLTSTNKCGMKGANLNSVLLESEDPRNAAKLYLLYKFISIVETYSGFCNGFYLTDEHYRTLEYDWPNRDAIGTINQDLDLILETNDYRTLKFKQVVNYLKQDEDFYGAEICLFPGIKYIWYLSFDSLAARMKGKSLKDIQWFLPCPIFKGDIILQNGDDYFPLETLSSGMIQRLNSVGSLIYHLRNLDDEQNESSLLAYDNVSVILEEVELYYHPEYQKSYVNYLLEQIERAELSRIKRINLIFITHSPFILSDILNNNVLCLEDGHQVQLRLHTFGANIHDMLRNPFFMKDGTVGDFAQKLINKIIVSLAIYETIKNQEGDSVDIEQFKEDNVELSDCLDFLPIDGKRMLINTAFKEKYTKQYLEDAISLLDEPILKEALKRELERIL